MNKAFLAAAVLATPVLLVDVPVRAQLDKQYSQACKNYAERAQYYGEPPSGKVWFYITQQKVIWKITTSTGDFNTSCIQIALGKIGENDVGSWGVAMIKEEGNDLVQYVQSKPGAEIQRMNLADKIIPSSKF